MDSQKKKLLEERYDRILNVGFCLVPYQDVSDLIHPDIMLIGTTIDEKVFSLSEVTEFIKSQYQHMEGFEPSVERKRLYTHISEDDNSVIIVEEITLIISSPEEVNTIFVRCSCVMEYMDGRWKMIHWHSSTPVESENDHWHMEEWKREKEKLQKLVDEQTADLKNKNREMEIESALEKIRSGSLAMHKTDDLRDVVAVLFEQMQELSVDMGFASVSIFIFEEGSRDFTQWLPTSDGVESLDVPYIDHKISSDLFDAWEDGVGYFEKIYTLEEKNAWLEKGFEHTDYKHLPSDFKTSLLEAPCYAMSISLAKHSGICIPSFEGKLPSDENVDILKRVGKVFEQAYTRFLDLQKAETQTREAQIEVAVERVRAKALAMHKSEEILQVAITLKEQMEGLHLNGVTAATIYLQQDDHKIRVWDITALKESEQGPQLSADFTFRLEDTDPDLWVRRVWNAKEKYSVIEMRDHDFSLCEQWIRGFDEKAADSYVQFIEATQLKHSWHPTIQLEKGKLSIDFILPPPSEIEFILPKMGAAFDLAYRRFLDLQKAEAQAREAQISLAVERVRAKALAMFKSEEILDVVYKLKEEIMGLDIPGVSAATIHLKEPDGRYRAWDLTSVAEDENKLDISLDISYNMEDTHPDFFMREVWARTEDYFVVTQDGDRTPHTVQWLQQNGYSREAKEFEEFLESSQLERAYHPTVPLNNGRMCIDLLEPPEPEVESILKKMAGAFDLAYKRFEDLQKAEAQAREAQIEAALERVRSRSLAMHHSSELSAVVDTLLQEFTQLEFTLTFCIINLIDEENLSNTVWAANPETGKDAESYYMKFEDYPFHHAMWKAWKEKDKRFVYTLEGEEKKIYDEYLYKDTEFRRFPKHVQEANKALDRYVAGFTFFKYSGLQTVSVNEITEAELEILERFGRVFEQAYTRFLDLQKAEVQAREAQIEAALERVRSASMAMHKTDELGQVVDVLFRQFSELKLDFYQVWINIFLLKEGISNCWFSPVEGVISKPYTAIIPLGPFEESSIKSWRAGEEFSYLSWRGLEEVNKIAKSLTEMTGHPSFQRIQDLKQMDRMEIVDCNHKYGVVALAKNDDITQSDLSILKRFTKVFEQTYTRFLDLQKAETQAREAKIETALEKVRSRTMGMQSSDELPEVANLLFLEVQALGIPAWSCGYCILLEDRKSSTCIMSSEGTLQKPFMLPHYGEVSFEEWDEFVHSKETFFTQELEGEAIVSHYDFMKSLPQLKSTFKMLEEAGLSLPTYQINHLCKFSHGFLLFITYEPVPDAHVIFKRFTNVFDQTYTRFLDLKKAEAQAREAQIETSLEKVRAQSMGMQGSEDLSNVASVMFDEMKRLGGELFAFGIVLCDKDKDTVEQWHNLGNEGMISPFTVPIELDYIHKYRYDQWIAGEELFSVEIPEDYIKKRFDLMFELPSVRAAMDEVANQGVEVEIPDWEIDYGASFKYGYLLVSSRKPFEESHIFPRFAKVFDQAYTRFQDLQKAEAQAREAQIGNALEKVRSRSLAMQNPDELIEVAQLLREEMGALGVEELETSSIYIHDESSNLTQCWFTIKDGDDPDKSVTDQMTIDLKDTWVGRQMDDFYLSDQVKASILMKGDHRIEWIRYCEEKSDLFGTSEFYGESIPERTYHLYKFSNGFLGAASPGDISDESWDLMRRATAVFSFAYTRFRDLQKAEESARQSRQQASLDRVRADISSMRTSDDLNKVTPLIWRELTTLGIPFIRCGVFIIHEEKQEVEVYLSKPDGTSLAVMHLPFNSNELAVETVNAWKNKEVYTQQWTKEEFLEWGRSMMEQNQVADMKTYQGAEEAPEFLNLQFIPFNQGMLYVGSTGLLGEEDISLSESLANAFSIAYARYEDFIKLEKAKAGIEEALTELKATQSQLIQQEKLASLGQLTAGIAHEIKNPLNFVNNFSEVSLELVEEVRHEIRDLRRVKEDRGRGNSLRQPTESAEAERKRGVSVEAPNPDLILEILDDIEANLRKIHEHGSRADGIVKSMLQHSRGGDGKMELTSLNPIIKEYLNLAFHGMRAGKDAINVDIDLQLDESVGEVPLIAEDFSRVILNLCNNAFDAMQGARHTAPRQPPGPEKYRQGSGGYEPKLTVRTKSENGQVLIEIEDNGPGIPDEIKDKILQPFFTTKKGTQGTGLGLSITNDIVKAHGGTINIKTKEHEGTTFTIKLPI